MSEKTRFALIYEAIGYSPGCQANGEISRSYLRNAGDGKKLMALNSHPLMVKRGHQLQIID